MAAFSVHAQLPVITLFTFEQEPLALKGSEDRSSEDKVRVDAAGNASESNDRRIIYLSPHLNRAALGQRIVIPTTDGKATFFEIDRTRSTNLGNTIVAAKNLNTGDRMILTISPSGDTLGWFSLGPSAHRIAISGSDQILYEDRGSQSLSDSVQDDVIKIPIPQDLVTGSGKKQERQTRSLQLADPSSTDIAELDFLVYADASLSNGPLVVDQNFAEFNQIMIDSQVYVRARVARLKALQIPLSFSGNEILNFVGSNGGWPLDLSEAGADLTAVFVRESRDLGSICGIADMPSPINNLSINDPAATQAHINSTLNFLQGYDWMSLTRVNCTGTFAHEVGHNLGSAHDWRTIEKRGETSLTVLSYSKGMSWLKHPELALRWPAGNCPLGEGPFGTVMAQTFTGGCYRKLLLSSPNLTCYTNEENIDWACGLAEGETYEADNVRVFNQLRFIYADKRPRRLPNITDDECSSENVVLTSQLEVDNFQGTYGQGKICSKLVQGLSISGVDIVSLEGLEDLKSVGHLTITGNPILADLTGLNGLESINGWFVVNSNPSLESFEGLENLGIVQGALSVRNNAILENFNGLQGLARIDGALNLRGNENLGSLEGLDNLEILKGDLDIRENAVLDNLDALLSSSMIPVTNNAILIYDNPRLRNIDGLVSPASSDPLTAYTIAICNNQSLKNIDGLSSISRAGNVMIGMNSSLENLDGIANLALVNLVSSENRMPMNRFSPAGHILLSSNSCSIFDFDDNLAGTRSDQLTGTSFFKVNAQWTNIPGQLYIRGVAIEDLDFLSSLNSLGSLTLLENPYLSSLEGIENLNFTAAGPSYIPETDSFLPQVPNEIRNNMGLLDCSALLENSLTAADLGDPDCAENDRCITRLRGNPKGCNSVDEIKRAIEHGGAKAIMVPSTSCKASDPAAIADFIEMDPNTDAILKFSEGGLINISWTFADITCPLPSLFYDNSNDVAMDFYVLSEIESTDAACEDTLNGCNWSQNSGYIPCSIYQSGTGERFRPKVYEGNSIRRYIGGGRTLFNIGPIAGNASSAYTLSCKIFHGERLNFIKIVGLP